MNIPLFSIGLDVLSYDQKRFAAAWMHAKRRLAPDSDFASKSMLVGAGHHSTCGPGRRSQEFERHCAELTSFAAIDR